MQVELILASVVSEVLNANRLNRRFLSFTEWQAGAALLPLLQRTRSMIAATMCNETANSAGEGRKKWNA